MTFGIDPASIATLLDRHAPADATEAAHLRDLKALASNKRACQRTLYEPGHFTASAFVRNADGFIGLIMHPKLGLWLQPGGHLEPEDHSAVGAAARELLEETGLRADPASGVLLDIDVHDFPARGADPAHKHYDLRFLFTAYTAGSTPGEHEFRWTDPRAVVADAGRGESLTRAMRKVIALG